MLPTPPSLLLMLPRLPLLLLWLLPLRPPPLLLSRMLLWLPRALALHLPSVVALDESNQSLRLRNGMPSGPRHQLAARHVLS